MPPERKPQLSLLHAAGNPGEYRQNCRFEAQRRVGGHSTPQSGGVGRGRPASPQQSGVSLAQEHFGQHDRSAGHFT